MAKPTALGVHIFAGGFTLGVKRAGFDVLAQFEGSQYGVASTRHNHPGLRVETDPATWPAREYTGRVDFVYGNPPCAPFSGAGISTQKVGQMHDWWKRDPRVSCIHQMFGVLEVVRPKVWAWESVQLAFKRGRELVDELTEVARGYGYAASYVLLNAAHLGVPQIRRRFFCVFHRVDIPWEYPEPGNRPVRTVRDAWEPLLSGAVIDTSPVPPTPTKNPEHMALLAKIPPGGSLRKAWETAHPPGTWTLNQHGHVKGRPRFLDVRLDFNEPSPTLTGGATKFHPTEMRYITLLEQQLLCGYPADYTFIGPTLADRYAQTAQAVMPPVGEWLARNVRRAVEANVPADPNVATIVDLERWAAEVVSRSATGHHAPALTVQDEVVVMPESTFDDVTDALDAVESVSGAPPEVVVDPAQLAMFDSAAPPVAVPVDTPPPPPVRHRTTAPTTGGPTAMARSMIAAGSTDTEIMTAYAAQFGPSTTTPMKFTSHDLKRLRAKIAATKES